MIFILTMFFNAFFLFWNQFHHRISLVITRVFPTEATHVYGAKKMLKMIPIVRFLRLCPKKIQCPLIYLFEKNLMNYYYSYFTDFLTTCVLEAEITRFVYPWFHCPSYIRIRGRRRTLHKRIERGRAWPETDSYSVVEVTIEKCFFSFEFELTFIFIYFSKLSGPDPGPLFFSIRKKWKPYFGPPKLNHRLKFNDSFWYS